MKLSIKQYSLLLLAGLIFSGCYTQYNATLTEEHSDAEYLGEGWFAVYDFPFFIDPTTRQWYMYYGIDLTADKNFLATLPFRYHHRTSTYFYSPFRSSFFYNYPGYSNQFFFRTRGVRPWYAMNSIYHPPFYSNQYMWSFYYNRWANIYHWQSSEPNFGRGNQIASNSNIRKTSVQTESINRARQNQVSSRLGRDGDGLINDRSRSAVPSRSLETVSLNDRQSQHKVRDRRGDFSRDRSVRSPLSSWSTWEQQNNYTSGRVNRTADSVRATSNSRGTVNRASANRSAEGSTVRGSSNRDRSSGGATRSSGSSRSSGEGSSNRGSN